MRLALSFLALLALFAAPFGGAKAETANGSQPRTQEAKKEVSAPRPFNIVVMGDSLSDGMWASLYRGYIRQQKHIRVARHGVNSAGFTAYSFETDFEKIAAKGPIDLVVFMVGANDRQRAFAQGNGKEWAAFRTDKWYAIYRQNIQRFLGLLQQKKVPTVWIGLPIMRKEDASEDAKMMNAIYRELATAHGKTPIDLAKVIAGDDGTVPSPAEHRPGASGRSGAPGGHDGRERLR